jgi:Raf kinase inhibitor-like YbhB/YbcL family protein
MNALSLRVTSDVFASDSLIPDQYTCDGANISPPISWEAEVPGTESFALIVDDPDASSGLFTHWLVYDLPARVTSLPENVPPHPTLENEARQGRNDFGRVGYGGPCPPSGRHRYVFTVYALNARLGLAPEATKRELLDAMDGHVLTEGRLTGRYLRG